MKLDLIIDELLNFDNYLDFVQNLSNEEKESLGEDFSSWWMYAYYIHKKYNLPIDNFEPVYEEISEIFPEENGLYSCYIENDHEFHHFIVVIIGDNLTLYSTYGGQYELIIVKRNKYKWINNLSLIFIEDNIDVYKSLFGIKELNYDTFDMNLEIRYTKLI